MIRYCCICGRDITACFGLVLARDMIALIEGWPVDTIRELCGLCGELYKPDDGDPKNWRRLTEEEMIEKGFIPIGSKT